MLNKLDVKVDPYKNISQKNFDSRLEEVRRSQ